MTVLITVPYSSCKFLNIVTHLCMVFSNAMAVRIYLDLHENGVDDMLVMHQSKRQQKRHYVDYIEQLGKILTENKIDIVFIIESFYGFNDSVLLYMNKNKYSKKLKEFLAQYKIQAELINTGKSRSVNEVKKFTDNYIVLNFNRDINERMRKFIGEKISEWIQQNFNG